MNDNIHDAPTWPPRRRANDSAIDHLHECVEGLKTRITGLEVGMAKNTELTESVHSILHSFKMLGTLAKWMTVLAAAITSSIAAVKALKGGW